MSKIGRTPVSIPSGATIEQRDGEILVRGPKGELRQSLPKFVTIKIEDNEVVVTRANDSRQAKANHGLVRSLIANMVVGVTDGYQKKLELVGTGYRAAMKGAGLTLTIGFSHPVEVPAVAGIQFQVEGSNIIMISGTDKQLVGQVAADIRKIKPPEPYKGKGIKYVDEVIRRKQGKSTVK